MNYVLAKYREHQRDMAYRSYVCTSLQNIPQNKYISKPYDEIIQAAKVDERSGDEVAEDVVKRLGLKFKSEVNR